MKFEAFLINMKGNPERLAYMSRQLNNLGIPFAIQEGTDGKTYNFKNEYNEALSKKLNGSVLSPGERGCALSHRRILEKILEEHVDYALILEDDIELPGTFKGALDEVLRQRASGETNWEYLAFNYPSVGIKFIRLWIFLLFEQFRKNPSIGLFLKIPIFCIKFFGISLFSAFEGIRDARFKKIYKYGKPARFYRPLYLAGCYLVTNRGAQKLLSINTKLVYAADRIQNVARVKKGLKLFAFVPLLVKQRRDKFESTIYQNKNYQYEKYD